MKRNILEARIENHNKAIHLLNTHASAFAKDDTKKKQLEIIKQYADSLNQKGEQFILGGDFNSLPPFSAQTSKFPDSACTDGEFEADDYSKETDWMMPFYNCYQAAIPLNEYKLNNVEHCTHTTDKNGFWNRKLDYIFTNGKFVKGSEKTLQQWMKVSDHAPIIVNFEL